MSNPDQTLCMALGIVQAVADLQQKYPDAESATALWQAMLALYGRAAARHVESLSVCSRDL